MLGLRLNQPHRICMFFQRMLRRKRLAFLSAVLLCSGAAACAQSATTLSITSAGSAVTTVAPGSVVTLTATVQFAGSGVTVGQVNFCDATATYCTDIHLLGTAQLTAAGPATVRLTPAPGVHSYKAVFVGTKSVPGSASSASSLTVTIPTYKTATTITQSGSGSVFTLAGTVTGIGSRTIAPTGSVSFIDTSNGNAVLGVTALGAGTPGMSYSNAATLATGLDPESIGTGDFNGDGHPDLVTANYLASSVTLFLGHGDGTFAAGVDIPAGSEPSSIVVGDFNGDGKLDIVTTNDGFPHGAVTVLLGNGDGTFTTVTTHAQTGVSPRGMTVGDFNHDGKLDLAVACQNSTTLTILLGNGDGTFTAAASPAGGSGPYAIVTGDLNGDGTLDLVVSDYNGNTLTVLLGNGDGTFQTKKSYTTGSSPQRLVLADLNHDGNLDIVVAAGGSLNLFMGSGDGNFTAIAGITTGQPRDVKVGDFDGDGIVDLATADSGSNAVLVFLGKGDGSFISGGTATGGAPYGGFDYALALADFDGDGYPDVATTIISGSGPVGTSAVFLTQLTETAVATASGITPTGFAGTHLVEATYPGDASYNPSTSNVTSLNVQVTPTLTWAPSVSTITSGTPLGAGQLNATVTDSQGFPLSGTFVYTPSSGTVLPIGTQTLSVVFTPDDNTYTTVSGSVQITVTAGSVISLSVTSNNFQAASYPSGSVLTLSAIVTNQGVPVTRGRVNFCDASAKYCTDIYLLGTAQLTNTGTGTATLALTPALGNHSYKAVFLGTSNAPPGISDVVAEAITGVYTTQTTIRSSGSPGNYELTATIEGIASPFAVPTGVVQLLDTSYANSVLGEVSLGPALPYESLESSFAANTDASPFTVAVGDFNRDGKPDFVVVNQGSNTLTVELGNGDGTFSQTSNPATGNAPQSVAVGDFNCDGIPDLVVGNYEDNDLTVLLGNGDGTFNSAPLPATGMNPSSIAVDDFNMDGISDLAVTNDGDNTVTILLGVGDGTFTSSLSLPLGDGAHSIAIADFNGDGKPDLAVSNIHTSYVSTFLGNGDGTFTSGANIQTGLEPQSVASADFNGDGRADLAVTNYADNNITILLGNGDGSFASYSTPQDPDNPPGYIAVGDFNGDGIPDLITSNRYGRFVNVLVNQGDGNFNAPISASGINGGELGLAVADFNGDGISDFAIALPGSGGGSYGADATLTKLVQRVSAVVDSISLGANGMHQVLAHYEGDANFASSDSDTTPLYVGQIPPTLSWPLVVTSIPYGTPLGPNQLDANATDINGEPLPGTFVYTPAAGTILPIGPQTLNVTFTPTDPAYLATQAIAQINVTPATTVVVDSKNFGSVAVGQSVTMNISYTQGKNPVIATTLQEDFEVSTVNCSDYCVATITFVPQYPGLRTDAVTVTDDSGTLLAKTFVYGVGTGPQFGFELRSSMIRTSALINQPAAIAIGPDSSTFIADSDTNQVFAVSGSTATPLPIGGLGVPAGMAIDGSQTLYVVDHTNNVIRSFNLLTQAQGVVSTTPLSLPNGIAVDAAGALYITDAGHNRVIKIDNQGNETTLASDILGPLAIAVDSGGNVFYSDQSTGGEITKLPAGGGQPVSIATSQSTVRAIAIDASGTIYFTTDYGFNTVGLGGAVTYQTVPGPYPDGIQIANGLAVDSKGNAYITQTSLGRSVHWDRSQSSLSYLLQAPVIDGSGAEAQAVVIQNTGNTPLTLGTFTFSGTVFTLSPSNPCLAGSVVTPGASCNAEVYFTPRMAGIYDETFTITSNSLNNTASSNVSYLHGVAQQYPPSTTALSVSSSSVTEGQPVTLTATVTDTAEITPTGPVNFLDGTTVIGSAALAETSTSGQAIASVTVTLAAGTHSVTAMYDGTNVQQSTSAAETIVVSSASPTGSTTMLALSSGSITLGQSVILTATVADTTQLTPAGTVNFFDGTQLIGSSTLSANAIPGTANAAFTATSLAIGTHSLTAMYSGNANITMSTSTAQTVVVSQISTGTILGVSSTSVTVGQAETLTATIAGAASPALSGTVTFFDGTASLGTANVTSTATGGSATLTLSSLSTGTHQITAHYGGNANYVASISTAQTVTVSLLTQTITFPIIPNHTVGDAPFTLSATASSQLPVSYTVTSGPAMVSASTVTLTGAGTVMIQAAQAGDATYAAAAPVTQSFKVAAVAPTLIGISPAVGVIGSAATTVTLTGTNFSAGDAIQLNGTVITSTFVNATTLTTVIPASFFATSGTGQIAVFDSASNTTTSSLPFVVSASPAILFRGPITAAPGEQPALTFQLVNPYPVAIAGTLTLAFAPVGSKPVDDPSVQFSSGGRMIAFAIPALATTTPAVQLQTGTVAGTATITLVITANGSNVTPANVTPVIITIPAAVPTISTTAISKTFSTLSVAIQGFSNTREVTTAIFHFVAANGRTISNPDITAPVTAVFADWYASPESAQYGSAFTFTQDFTFSDDSGAVKSVTVTLVNSVGNSASGTAQ